MAMEKTYSMIKPDGVANGHIGEIVNRFERAGLKIERMEMGMLPLSRLLLTTKNTRVSLSTMVLLSTSLPAL